MGTTEYQKEQVSYTEYAEFNLGSGAVRTRPPDPAPLLAFVKKYPEGVMVKNAYSGWNILSQINMKLQKYDEALTSMGGGAGPAPHLAFP